MQVKDLPHIQALDAENTCADARNPVFLQLALANEPHACTVVEEADSVSGFCFTAETESVGALTLLHLPANGRDRAMALIREVAEALASRCHCCLTHAHSEAYEQSALLLQAGFHPVEPQYVLRAPQVRADHVAQHSDVPQQVVWSDVWGVSPQLKAAQQAGIGTNVTVTGAAGICGVALVEFTARRYTGGKTAAFVGTGGVVRSLGAGPLRAVLAAAQTIAREGGRHQLFITLNTFYQREMTALLADGWCIIRSAQRFVLGTTLSRYRQLQMQPAVDLGYWQL
jgi:hypothetical protein